MRKYLWLWIASLLVVGCAKKEPTPMWPARVVEFKNFSEEQRSAIVDSIRFLNEKSPRSVVNIEGTSGFPITFELVDPDPSALSRGGLAEVSENNCTIQISKRLYEKDYENERTPIVMHEIGHCGGLLHVNDSSQIMYRSATTLDRYSKEAFDQYFTTLFSQIGL